MVLRNYKIKNFIDNKGVKIYNLTQLDNGGAAWQQINKY